MAGGIGAGACQYRGCKYGIVKDMIRFAEQPRLPQSQIVRVIGVQSDFYDAIALWLIG